MGWTDNFLVIANVAEKKTYLNCHFRNYFHRPDGPENNNYLWRGKVEDSPKGKNCQLRRRKLKMKFYLIIPSVAYPEHHSGGGGELPKFFQPVFFFSPASKFFQYFLFLGEGTSRIFQIDSFFWMKSVIFSIFGGTPPPPILLRTP